MTYYHGSHHDFTKPNSFPADWDEAYEVLPGNKVLGFLPISVDGDDCDHDVVYVTPDVERAAYYGSIVYRVEVIGGEVEADPKDDSAIRIRGGRVIARDVCAFDEEEYTDRWSE